MDQVDVLYVVNLSLQTIIYAAMPPLLLGLVVGLIVSIFQTVTSIQEQTLAFVPKILAVFISLMIFGPFILNQLLSLMRTLLSNIPSYIR